MKKVYNKWLDKTAEYTELKYKTHYKKKKTIERKIISYLNRSIPYFLTTNALEGKTIKWIAKGKNFTHEGMDERIFEDDEELVEEQSLMDEYRDKGVSPGDFH